MYRAYVVDDERWSLSALTKIFRWEKHGFLLEKATTDPAVALADILADPPDVVFTDMRMPGVSGVELMGRARERGVTSEFVVISGYGEFQYAREALVHRAFDYCLKPLLEGDAAELLERLRMKLDGLANVKTEKDAFERMLRYINDHAGEPLKLNEIAAMHFLTPNYASSLFRARLNLRFSDYLAKLRSERAAYMLRTSYMPIREIAAGCGYADARYFARAFQKAYGVSPAQYRKDFRSAT